MEAQQQVAQTVSDIALSIALDNWWCAIGGLGGMLYGYYRINFYDHDRKNWQWLFRMEVAGIATMFTALLMVAFVSAPNWLTKVIAILCFAPITGMATPPFYDYIWRPFLWPLLKRIARGVAKGAVKTAEAAGTELDEDNTLMKFAKGKK